MGINELRQYNHNSYDNTNMAEELIKLSNLTGVREDGIKEDLEKALYHLETIAENEYNNDYWRTLYNVLFVITGEEWF